MLAVPDARVGRSRGPRVLQPLTPYAGTLLGDTDLVTQGYTDRQLEEFADFDGTGNASTRVSLAFTSVLVFAQCDDALLKRRRARTAGDLRNPQDRASASRGIGSVVKDFLACILKGLSDDPGRNYAPS